MTTCHNDIDFMFSTGTASTVHSMPCRIHTVQNVKPKIFKTVIKSKVYLLETTHTVMLCLHLHLSVKLSNLKDTICLFAVFIKEQFSSWGPAKCSQNVKLSKSSFPVGRQALHTTEHGLAKACRTVADHWGFSNSLISGHEQRGGSVVVVLY